jgi:hypothetical protein
MSAFKLCFIRAIQHRKQGPTAPTLVLEFKPDTPTEKQRKRRSSRTGGLSSKDPWANTLLFRSVPEERYSIYDWLIRIKPQLPAESQESLDEIGSAMSPISPSGSVFTNPFSSRESRAANPRPDYQRGISSQSTSSYHPSQKERPATMISPSPSLRSRRSDLSSQASSQHPTMGFTSVHGQNYTTVLPSDLPSPASTSGYDSQFIEGWTSAQGRSSALSSHTRGSNSIASVVPPVVPIGSTPPGPRETILDRAFQLRYIPGGDRLDKDEEKISSIARFEALMKEADERKRQNSLSVQAGPGNSSWDLDEESEDSSSGEPDEDDDADEPDISDPEIAIPTPAQRALEYIARRNTPLPSPIRPLSPAPSHPPIPFLNPQAMSAFHGHSTSMASDLRPRTGSPTHRKRSRPNSLALPSRSISVSTIPSLRELRASSSGTSSLAAPDRDPKEQQRQSSTSVKRLSFSEFAKRLSSTSSLLLVQTNASSSSGRDGSRRPSSEFAAESDEKVQSPQTAPPLRADPRDKRCGWRGSVGVFGSEGGFL